jgi:[ribosomal protein S5]-alanine N-acetyltransferase
MNGKNPQLQVKGKNVFLRYVTVDDFEEMQTLFRESRKFYKGLVDTPDNLEAFTAFVARNDSEANECFVICRREDGRIVGSINLSQIFRRAFQNAYLGYSLGVKYIGCGFMTEAVRLILRFAFTDLKLHRIEANVQPENRPSIAVLKRCGFTREGFSRKYLKIAGQWRDHERFAIIIEDWKTNSKK